MEISECFTFTINGNIKQPDIDKLIHLFCNCESTNDGAVNILTGEVFKIIKIIIIPLESEGEYIAEVDPLFLGYITLLMNKLKKIYVLFTIYNKHITNLENKFSDAEYIRCEQISNRAFSISDQISFIKDYADFKERISLQAHWYNKVKKEALPVQTNSKTSKRFFPTIIISSKADVELYFSAITEWNNHKVAKNYLNKIEEINNNLVNLKAESLCIIQIFVLRLLLSDDNPKAQKKNLTKEFIVYCLVYSKHLSIGLRELALNIVEHSRENENSEIGIGIITGRIFEKERLAVLKGESEQSYIKTLKDKSFNIDLNIIDLGYKSLREKYIENIERNSEEDSENIFNIDYPNDIEVIKNIKYFHFSDFYLPNTKTDHQLNKLISRYGIQYFTHVLTQRFKALVKAISHNESLIIEGQKQKIQSNIQTRYGTSYNCIIPFESFNDFYTQTKINELGITQSSADNNTLRDIEKFEVISLSKLNNTHINQIIEIDSIPNLADDKYKFIREIYYNFLIINKELRNNIFLIDASKLAISTSSDWIRLLSVITLEFKNLIILNQEKEITKEIFDFRRAKSSNPAFAFWSQESNILFYSYQKEQLNTYGRYGATVLTGRNEAQFNYINLNVWKNHYSFYNGFIVNQTNVEKFNATGPLFSNDHLKYFDLILKTNTDKSGELTLFEHSLRYALNKELPKNLIIKTNNKGYKIKDTHFRLGSKIHISSFYYAKRVFQNSFFTGPLAFLLSEQLYYKIKENYNFGNFTLIGYESYSEFLISTTRSLLSKRLGKNYTITHCTINSNTYLSRPLESIKENLFIVVPIASSFSTSIKIKNDLEAILNRNSETRNKKYTFLEPNLNLILVANENFEHDIEETEEAGFYRFSNPILRDYGWDSINPTKKMIRLNVFGTSSHYQSSKESIIQKYFIPVYSKWQKADECKLCFPENIKDETCLVETGNASITPRLIFGLPKTKPNKHPNNILDLSGSLLYGNLKKGNNNYLYFTRVGEIINKKENGRQINKDKIVIWLKELKNSFLKMDDLTNKKIVLVTPSSINKSNFIDLVNEIVFGYTANCLSISLQEDYIENAESLYADGLYRVGIVIYVDDVLSTAKSFIETNYIVKYIRKKLGSGQGIDYCISLLNKMSFDCEENLLLKLTPLEGNITKHLSESHNRLFYFTKINNPTIDEPNNEFPLNKEANRYFTLSQTASLDSIRSLFYKKYIKLQVHDLTQKLENRVKDQIDDDIAYGNKKLYQLLILNKIYSIFEHNVEKERNEEDYESLRQKKLDRYFNTPKHDSLRTFRELKDEIIQEFYIKKQNGLVIRDKHKVHERILLQYEHNIEFVILKIICSTPLVYYKDIRESAFKWIIELLELHRTGDTNSNIIGIDNLSSDNLQDYFKVNANSYYSEYQKLKFLLKRSVQLKCNYIIHKDFLISLKNLINLLYENYGKLNEIANSSEAELASLIKELFRTGYSPGNIELFSYVKALNKCKLISIDHMRSLLLEKNEISLRKEAEAYDIKNFTGGIVFEDEKKNNFEEAFDKIKIKEKFRITTSKKLIYEFIAIIQELIYEHEPKAIKLDETIDNLIAKPNDINGDFNHYLRLLKLENTAAIENFYQYFFNKEKNKQNATIDTKNIRIEDYSSDPKFNSIENLVKIGDDYEPFINFLKLKGELNNWQQINQRVLDDNSSSVIESRVSMILEDSVKILGENIEECYFSINFKKLKHPEPKDIFFFDKHLVNNDEVNKKIFIDSEAIRNSLTYKMYTGIFEYGYETIALSNFEFTKRDNIITYRDNTSIILDTIKHSWEFSKGNKDCNILLVRISEFTTDNINNEDDRGSLITQAVLTYRLKESTRVNEKRLRMLLLLKEPLSRFINSNLLSDNIFDYINNKRNSRYSEILGHRVATYLSNQNLAYKEHQIEIVDIINDALAGQLKAYDINKNDNNYKISVDQLKNRIQLILNTDYLSGRSFDIQEYDIGIDLLESSLTTDSFLYEIVLTEILINARIHCPDINSEIKIYFENQFLVVKSRQKCLIIDWEVGRGTKMCKDICSNLGKELLIFPNVEELGNIYFIIKIPFKNEEK
jgi:hypothetical protein